MKQYLVVIGAVIILFMTSSKGFDYSSSWLGNTFPGGECSANETNKCKWVQNFIHGMKVEPDGTIYTTSYWDEGHREHGIYRNGDVIGNKNVGVNSLTCQDKNGGNWTIQNYVGRFFWDNPYPIAAEKKPFIQGPAGKTITDVVDPSALAIDNNNRLWVAENGSDQNIRIYDISGQPKLIDTYGEKGGIFSGQAGVIEPKKFWGIRGLGFDAQGNIYVGNTGWMSQCGGGTDIRCFSPSGQMLWNLLGLCFVNSADFDPATDGNDIYLNTEHIIMDWNQPVGKQWKFYAATINPFAYPDDPRLLLSLESVFIRRIEGKKFMFLTNMYSEFLCGYRFDGEIAVPCLKWAVGWDGQWDKYKWQIDKRPKYPVPTSKRWLWRDANGDGQVSADEFSIWDIGYLYNWAIDIDSKGDIRLGGRVLTTFNCKGIDQNGVPIYSTTDIVQQKVPENDLTRLIYLAETDVMYMAFSGAAFPDFTKIVRYDKWSSAPTLKWTINLPFEKRSSNWEENIVPKSFTVAGDYVFVTYTAIGPHAAEQPGTTKRGEINVYDANSGKYLQPIFPGPEVNYYSGCIDIPYAINSMQRSNGEYLVANEEDGKGKIILYRFNTPQPGIHVEQPLIEPRGGYFENPTSVKLSCATPEAKIYYTLNGSEPTTASTLYDGNAISINKSALLRVRAFKEGLKPSTINGADFIIRNSSPVLKNNIGYNNYTQGQINFLTTQRLFTNNVSEVKLFSPTGLLIGTISKDKNAKAFCTGTLICRYLAEKRVIVQKMVKIDR